MLEMLSAFEAGKKISELDTASGSVSDMRIEVLDTGKGIAPEDLPYIWDRYYKVDKNHRRSTVGAGLGLSIVKGVLEAHGAEYGVASTLGEGSDFWFRLPLLPPDAALTAESEENHSDFS